MKEFERNIIKELLDQNGLADIQFPNNIESEAIEYSGVGYFLTIKGKNLPKNRIVLNEPAIVGMLGDIDVGYLAFVENGELTLECYSYDQEVLPKNRDQQFVRHAT